MFLEKKAKVHIIIAAAGRGSRMGKSINKQFLPLKGRAILLHTLDRVFTFLETLAFEARGQIILLHAGDELDTMEALIHEDKQLNTAHLDRLHYVQGGPSRRASIYNGLLHLKSTNQDPDSIVMIHDGARCLTPLSMWKDIFEQTLVDDAVCPGVAVHDTLRKVSEDNHSNLLAETISRDYLYRIQTPQAARLSSLLDANLRLINDLKTGKVVETEFTDDTSILQHYGYPVHLAPGAIENIKITREEDLALAEKLL